MLKVIHSCVCPWPLDSHFGLLPVCVRTNAKSQVLVLSSLYVTGVGASEVLVEAPSSSRRLMRRSTLVIEVEKSPTYPPINAPYLHSGNALSKLGKRRNPGFTGVSESIRNAKGYQYSLRNRRLWFDWEQRLRRARFQQVDDAHWVSACLLPASTSCDCFLRQISISCISFSVSFRHFFRSESR